jgi:threonine/homoserine/homoserine lactone efflux protein
MTAASTLALFLAMVALAAIPGPGVLAVTARTVSAGLPHGLLAAAGVVAGDYVFITLALLGLVTLSSVLGEFFILVKYIGAAYLFWLGVTLICSKPHPQANAAISSPRHSASFFTGLVTTLGNPKAIVFYISFFPAFLDLSAVTIPDALILFCIATVSIGGVKALYAWLAYQASTRYAARQPSRVLRVCAGSMLVGSSIYVAARS